MIHTRDFVESVAQLERIIAGFNGNPVSFLESDMSAASLAAYYEYRHHILQQSQYDSNGNNLALNFYLSLFPELSAQKESLVDMFKTLVPPAEYDFTAKSCDIRDSKGTKGNIQTLVFNQEAEDTSSSYMGFFLQLTIKGTGGRDNHLYFVMVERSRTNTSEGKSYFDVAVIGDINGRYSGFAHSYAVDRRWNMLSISGQVKEYLKEQVLLNHLRELIPSNVKQMIENLEFASGHTLYSTSQPTNYRPI